MTDGQTDGHMMTANASIACTVKVYSTCKWQQMFMLKYHTQQALANEQTYTGKNITSLAQLINFKYHKTHFKLYILKCSTGYVCQN